MKTGNLGSKLVFAFALLLFIGGCTEEKMALETAPSQSEQMKIDTVQIPMEEEPGTQKNIDENAVPSLEILSPKDLEVIEGSSVIVRLNSKNFNIVLPNSPVKKGEGHFHAWLDSEEKKGSSGEFSFRDVISGRHSITAELRSSDHTPLSPRVIKTISINVRNSKIDKTSKFRPPAVEADDFGFYPATISVRKGIDAQINLSVRKENVYFNGLEFDSKHFSIEKILPGHSQIVQFRATEDFKVTSYWPNTKAKKAELKVAVE